MLNTKRQPEIVAGAPEEPTLTILYGLTEGCPAICPKGPQEGCLHHGPVVTFQVLFTGKTQAHFIQSSKWGFFVSIIQILRV